MLQFRIANAKDEDVRVNKKMLQTKLYKQLLITKLKRILHNPGAQGEQDQYVGSHRTEKSQASYGSLSQGLHFHYP